MNGIQMANRSNKVCNMSTDVAIAEDDKESPSITWRKIFSSASSGRCDNVKLPTTRRDIIRVLFCCGLEPHQHDPMFEAMVEELIDGTGEGENEMPTPATEAFFTDAEMTLQNVQDKVLNRWINAIGHGVAGFKSRGFKKWFLLRAMMLITGTSYFFEYSLFPKRTTWEIGIWETSHAFVSVIYAPVAIALFSSFFITSIALQDAATDPSLAYEVYGTAFFFWGYVIGGFSLREATTWCESGVVHNNLMSEQIHALQYMNIEVRLQNKRWETMTTLAILECMTSRLFPNNRESNWLYENMMCYITCEMEHERKRTRMKMKEEGGSRMSVAAKIIDEVRMKRHTESKYNLFSALVKLAGVLPLLYGIFRAFLPIWMRSSLSSQSSVSPWGATSNAVAARAIIFFLTLLSVYATFFVTVRSLLTDIAHLKKIWSDFASYIDPFMCKYEGGRLHPDSLIHHRKNHGHAKDMGDDFNIFLTNEGNIDAWYALYDCLHNVTFASTTFHGQFSNSCFLLTTVASMYFLYQSVVVQAPFDAFMACLLVDSTIGTLLLLKTSWSFKQLNELVGERTVEGLNNQLDFMIEKQSFYNARIQQGQSKSQCSEDLQVCVFRLQRLIQKIKALEPYKILKIPMTATNIGRIIASLSGMIVTASLRYVLDDKQ